LAPLSRNWLPRHGRRLCQWYAPHSACSFVTAPLALISSSNGRGNVMGLLALVRLPTFFTAVALISSSQLVLSSFSYISSSAQLSSCTCSPQCLPNCFPWTLVTARPLPTWSHSMLHSPTWTVVSTISSILLSLPPLV